MQDSVMFMHSTRALPCITSKQVAGVPSVHTCREERVLLHVIHCLPSIAITLLVLHCLQCIVSLHES